MNFIKIREQLSVYIKNEPGELAKIFKRFEEENVKVQGFTVDDTVDHAVVRFLVEKPDTAREIIKETGKLVVENSVLTIQFDEVKAIPDIAELLSEAGINIDYAYHTMAGGEPEGSGSFLVAKVPEPEKACEVLRGDRRMVGT